MIIDLVQSFGIITLAIIHMIVLLLAFDNVGAVERRVRTYDRRLERIGDITFHIRLRRIRYHD